MSDVITDTPHAPLTSCFENSNGGHCVEDAHWGYIVRTHVEARHGLIPSQSVSLVTGAGLLAAAIGMWLIPGMFFGADALMMRMFATIVFLAAAAMLLWYASRGTVSEIQVDNERGEIREVIRNHTGKMSVMGCYNFDAIDGVFTEPRADSEATALVLRYRNSSETVEVAYGREADLSALRDRISRDVVITGPTTGGDLLAA